MKILSFLGAAALIAVAGTTLAQTSHQGHGTAGRAADTPAVQAYRDANMKMHKDMEIKFSGDPDVDFVHGMIPHHQGAIEMAKVQLQYGKDEQTRKWAASIIRDQEREIAEMQEWLKAKKAK